MGSERHLPFGDFRPNHSCCFKLQKNNENRVHLEGTEWHLLINLTHSPVLKVSVAPFKEICPVHGTRDQVWAGGEISTSTILPLPPPPSPWMEFLCQGPFHQHIRIHTRQGFKIRPNYHSLCRGEPYHQRLLWVAVLMCSEHPRHDFFF